MTVTHTLSNPALAQTSSGQYTMAARDGAKLFYRAWFPARPARRALVLFHRGHEHSGRWKDTVDSLRLDDIAVFAWDARGHGRSYGQRGSAANLATLIRDTD